MPDVGIILFADRPIKNIEALFDEVRMLEKPSYTTFDKIDPLLQTPFKKTLYIDTDTLFLEPVDEIFSILDHYDFLYCHAPYRNNPYLNNYERDSRVPSCFVEANSGLLAYQKIDSVADLFRQWRNIAFQHRSAFKDKFYDQPSLREAIWNSSVKSYVLPPEYNMRIEFPVFRGGNFTAKILHGRDPYLSRSINKINKETNIVKVFDFRGLRLFRFFKGFLKLVGGKIISRNRN